MQVKITNDTVLGETIVKNPSFNTDITVTFLADLSVTVRMKAEKVKDDDAEYASIILPAMIKEWNLVDGKDKPLPITADVIENKLPVSLRVWLMQTVTEIFLVTMSGKKS